MLGEIAGEPLNQKHIHIHVLLIINPVVSSANPKIYGCCSTYTASMWTKIKEHRLLAALSWLDLCYLYMCEGFLSLCLQVCASIIFVFVVCGIYKSWTLLWSLDSGLESWTEPWSDIWMEFLNDAEVYNSFLLRIIT